jgi:integrase
MSVRRVKRKDPKTGAVREVILVDFVFRHADGRHERVRKVSPVQTIRGAEAYEKQLAAVMLNPPPPPPKPKKDVPTLGAFVKDRWWPTYPGAAGNMPSTVKEKDKHLRVHIVPFFSKMPMDQIKAEKIALFVAGLRGKGLAEKTVRNILSTLRCIFTSAQEWNVLDRVPVLPRVKVPEPSFDFYDDAEVEKLLSSAESEEERTIYLFAIRTGPRAGEQIEFQKTDIDWHNRKVRFRRSTTDGHTGPTKGKKERWVPLTGSLHDALKGIRHLRGPYVFCEADGSPLTLNMLQKRFWRRCERAGLRRIRWHDLRHTFASHCVMRGVPLKQVQEWLGHSTIEMTMRYAHLAPGYGVGLIQSLDEPLRQPNGNEAKNRTNS